MSKLVGNILPQDLYQRLAGNDLQAYAGKAILVCTVDTDGLPHPAMLSYFEVVAKDESNIRLAAFKNSSTTRNMRRNGKLTMLVLDTRTVYYIKGAVEELVREMSHSPQNSKFNFRVNEVLADETNDEFESPASLLTGVTYLRSIEPSRAGEMLAELLE